MGTNQPSKLDLFLDWLEDKNLKLKFITKKARLWGSNDDMKDAKTLDELYDEFNKETEKES